MEEQQDRAKLRHDRERLARSQGRQVRSAEERRVSGQDPNDQLAEHGGLAQALAGLAPSLDPDQDHGEHGQQCRDAVVARTGGQKPGREHGREF